MAVIVRSEALWVAGTNAYVVTSERGGLAVVVDAPPDIAGIERLLRTVDATPVALLVSHGHVDHTGGARAFVTKTGVSAYLHPDDEWLALDPGTQLRALFGPIGDEVLADFAPPDRFAPLTDGDELDLAGLTIEVLHTPGHTPGHCCFYLADEGLLFSGDQLFAGSIGRTDLPGGSYPQLMRSMAEKILPLPDATEVLPGHGPATTLARERRFNPFLQELA